jgi:hypothetical protein
MSQENVEESNCEVLRRNFAITQGIDVAPIIRSMLRGNAGGTYPPQLAGAFAAYLGLHHPDTEIDTSGVDMPGFGILHGLDGYRELWSRWGEDWEHYSYTHSNWAEVGEHVMADAEIQATGRSSGAKVIWKQCQVWTFRDREVLRWSLFKDRAEALEALGLEE